MSSQGPNLTGNTPEVNTTRVIINGTNILTTVDQAVATVTPNSIGLGNVANTAPSDLPISSAAQTALNNITKTSLGLGNVANTAPSDLPISTATQSALNLKAPLNNPSLTGIVNVNDLSIYKRNVSAYIQHPKLIQFAIGTSSHTPLAMDGEAVYLTDPTLCFAPATFYTAVSFLGTDVTGLTSSMVGLSNVANTKPSDLPMSTPMMNILATLRGNLQANIDAVQMSSAPLHNPVFNEHATVSENLYVSGTAYLKDVSGITPAMVGLGNVFNTAQTYFSSSVTVTGLSLFNVANTKPSDLPVSTATETALNLRAPLSNPNFTGF